MHAASLAVGFLLASLASGAVLLHSQEKKRFAYPWPESQEAAMARWMAACQTGPAHERLGELIGSWDMTMRMWMEGPEGKAMESKGSSEVTWFVEGRWLQSRTNWEFMGQKVTGLQLMGYDKFKERFVACMIDSFQTCMNSASGLFDKSGDNLILWGTIDEPMTPEQDKQVRYIYRGFGKDKWVLEVHDMMIGESNTKVLEFEHVRRK